MTDVSQVFSQHEILLTGGNGFLGKVLLGLLLDRYPGFKHLHVLIRPRKGLPAEERFQREVLESPALDAIVQRRGADFIRDKITVWPGDAALPSCGLQPSEIGDWRGRVGLILNCAGLVEFFPPVDRSLRANVDAVEHLLALAGEIGAKLLHVSTCYVAGKADRLIEETEPISGFYPFRQGPSDAAFDHARELASCRERIREIHDSTPGEEQDPARATRIHEKLVELGRQRATRWGWVNTYTYAKSIGEQVLAAQREVDYAIVRPAIVESSLRFPFPGWIEGGRTAAPLVLMALGGLKDWPARKDIPLEVVPVDLAAAAILVVAAPLLAGDHEPVYQLATADQNPFALEPLVRLLTAEARRNSSGRSNGFAAPFWVDPLPRLRFLSAEQLRQRRIRLQQRIDGAQKVIDGVKETLRKTGMPGGQSLTKWSMALRTLGLQAGFRERTLEQYLPFILENRYIFETHNIRGAYARIREEDRQRLPWDPERIDWREYWRNNQIGGIQKWVQPEAVREWAFRI